MKQFDTQSYMVMRCRGTGYNCFHPSRHNDTATMVLWNDSLFTTRKKRLYPTMEQSDGRGHPTYAITTRNWLYTRKKSYHLVVWADRQALYKFDF